MKKLLMYAVIIFSLFAMSLSVTGATKTGMIGINVLLSQDADETVLKELGTFGTVLNVLEEIDALTMRVKAGQLDKIKALPYVVAANPDAVRNGAPVDTVAATDFLDGLSTWDQDAINVTDYGTTDRQVDFDGTGVYVAVLDTGLVDAWRQYFPEERIAEEYAISFGGGGGEVGFVSSQKNKWEHDQNSHGTHVTSTILGYSSRGAAVNGTAPLATIIPVKVLNQSGSGWSSVIAAGITYVADLKLGVLKDSPVVINMSLGGSELDIIEKEAIDYAIKSGVIIVASAGNEGEAGMGYPGAYAPVISVAASGWVGEWSPAGNRTWWIAKDVADPFNLDDFYITDFSSRELDNGKQELDVVAPGSWIVGPYQVNSGQTSYYFLGGTSMSSPHVAGIAALMLDKNPGLSQSEVENLLKESAVPLPAGNRTITDPSGTTSVISWGDDATGSGLVFADRALDFTP